MGGLWSPVTFHQWLGLMCVDALARWQIGSGEGIGDRDDGWHQKEMTTMTVMALLASK